MSPVESRTKLLKLVARVLARGQSNFLFDTATALACLEDCGNIPADEIRASDATPRRAFLLVEAWAECDYSYMPKRLTRYFRSDSPLV